MSTENCRFTVGHNVCITAGSFALAGGSPASGTYSGNGVSGGIFNPSAAGAGTHTVTYTYSDGNGCTDSASQTIYVDVCTDVMAQNNNVSFIIYPNPNIGIFTIETKEKEYELIITNVLGEQILSQKNQNEKSEIDLSKQPNGIYFLQIKTEQGIMNKKIILN